MEKNTLDMRLLVLSDTTELRNSRLFFDAHLPPPASKFSLYNHTDQPFRTGGEGLRGKLQTTAGYFLRINVLNLRVISQAFGEMHHQSTCHGKIWQYRVFGCLFKEYIWIMSTFKKPCCCCAHGKKSKRLTLPNKLCVANYSFSSELCVSRE